MTEHGPVELVHLADKENSVIVRVVGATSVGLSGGGCLIAEIVVASEFANGRLAEVYLLSDDLDDWAEALDLLAAGRPVSWMDDGRNPEIRIELKGPYISQGETLNAVEVEVRDASVSLTSVRVLVRLPDDWVDAHRRRLEQVHMAWPLGAR
ncbi:DUF5959 family protein [Streptomyces sp. NPDC058686]|uniref:DUF5959 family protein n=1 Tax=Streptomyces sp. NPDC058686 TaxID=3346599 RepID=UPI003665E86C